MKLIPITYHNKNYPGNIISNIDEIAGHLDKTNITPTRKYSLHTEYSHMKRNLNSKMLEKYPTLKNSHKHNVPELWKDKTWAIEFANFIIELINDNEAPEIIEIHPPFNNYCKDFNTFFDIYEEFEKIILKKFPNVNILIENRCGTFYKGGTFLLSDSDTIVEFLKLLKTINLKLKIVLDYPQVFSAEKIKLDDIKLDKIIDFNNRIKEYIDYIGGFHIWGKRKNAKDTKWVPHTGTLNTFFSFNYKMKEEFLNSILKTFDDEKERFFVPEVNSGEEDLQSIIMDMEGSGFIFPHSETNMKEENYKQIVSIEWIDKEPYFNIFNKVENKYDLRKIYGIKTIEKGLNKRCIGYKNLITRQYINCKNIIKDKDKQCAKCKSLDEFSYCVICHGENCRNHSENALNRCGEEHYVYLTYFSKDKIKVGTAYHDRKEKRLLEQGAPVAFLIAKTKTGKIAREIEHQIVEMGYKEMVTTQSKAKNIILDNSLEKIIEILNSNILNIKEKIDKQYIDYFIEPELFSNIEKYNKVKNYLIKNHIFQISLFGEETDIDIDLQKADCFINNQEIVDVIGNIAIINDKESYKYINLKDLIGWEYMNIE